MMGDGLVNMETVKAKHLVQLRSQVKRILEEHPDTRNNDQLLILLFLEEEMGINTWGKFVSSSISQSIHFESITRARRDIQSSGEYLPTDETVIKRRRLQEVYRAVMSKGVS
jgi:hypothetical protein